MIIPRNLDVSEKVSILKKMLYEGQIDELDLFAVLCVMYYGFYCDLGREEEFLSKVNKLEYLETFKELNKDIHKTSIDGLILDLLNRNDD